MAADLTPEEREAFYDAEIAPALLELGKKCQDRGLSFLALIEWGADDLGRTCTIAKDGSQFFRVMQAATQARASNGAFNLDAFVIGMGRDTTTNRRPHSSIVLSQMGIDPDPEKRKDRHHAA